MSNEKKQSAGAGWKKQTSKGEVINLVIGDKRYNVWPNAYKKGDKDPDFRVYEDTYVPKPKEGNTIETGPVGGGDLPF